MVRSAVWRVGALMSVILTMSGCAGQGPPPPPYAELSEKQTAEDELPGGYEHRDGLDPVSIRFVGNHENVDYFLSKYSSDDIADGVCVLIVPVDTPEVGFRGCTGSTRSEMTVGASGFQSARYLPPGVVESEIRSDRVEISENLVLVG
jgi:hypothetical protein